MTLHAKLIEIQSTLNAPKDRKNSFGNYNYRSAEDILEALKPLLKAQDCTLKISDELVNIGDRYYIKATAEINDGTEKESSTGYAREEETKKGMDGSQITGASSSYARKYALNGLFLIDDGQDSDSTNTHDKTETKEAPKTYPKNDEDENKPWMNEPELEKLKENLANFEDADEAVKIARQKYKVSKVMEASIRKLF